MGVLILHGGARGGDEGICRVALERERDHAAQGALRVMGRWTKRLPAQAVRPARGKCAARNQCSRSSASSTLCPRGTCRGLSLLQRCRTGARSRACPQSPDRTAPVRKSTSESGARRHRRGRARHLIYALSWTQCGGLTRLCRLMRSGLSSQYQATLDRSYLITGGGLDTWGPLCSRITRRA